MNTLEKAIELLELERWDESHDLVQEGTSKYDYLIHGLLHRIEGDISNAQYWYSRADETWRKNTIHEEVKRVKELIKNES